MVGESSHQQVFSCFTDTKGPQATAEDEVQISISCLKAEMCCDQLQG